MDFERVRSGKFVEFFTEMKMKSDKLHCILLSRAPLPVYLKSFYLTKQLAIDTKESIWLTRKQLKEIIKLEKLSGCDNENELEYILNHCIQITQGYPIAVLSFIRHKRSGCDDYTYIRRLVREEMFEYYEQTLFLKWNLQHREVITKLAVFDKFNLDMAYLIIGESAKEALDSVLKISSILILLLQIHMNFTVFF